MRSSLVVSGGILVITGLVLFVTLAGEAWLALIAGGLVVVVAGFILDEVYEKVEAPAGQHFCPFCSTLVADEAERCGHCNGIQEPITSAPQTAAPQEGARGGEA